MLPLPHYFVASMSRRTDESIRRRRRQVEDFSLLLAGCMTLNGPFHPCQGDDHCCL